MTGFALRFLICNLYLSLILVGFLLIRHLLKNQLSARMSYRLWFPLLALFVVPFLPLGLSRFSFSFLNNLFFRSLSDTSVSHGNGFDTLEASSGNWINDLSLSVHAHSHSGISFLLLALWILGMLFAILLSCKSLFHLHRIKRSSLQLQDPEAVLLYQQCAQELGVEKEIPIYGTMYLTSPVMTGIIFPLIYLPLPLLSDCSKAELRYILLHELLHYKHKDAWANLVVNLIHTIYWFNPFVGYALREMRCDREMACDASVLDVLSEKDYLDYGNTLIDLAEKNFSSPFASGLTDRKKQLHRRISNIASYCPASRKQRFYSITAIVFLSLILLGIAPSLSLYASGDTYSNWEANTENITYVDYSSYFANYEGSFVLYNPERDTWKLYNKELALARTAPDSTYKIFSALFGLDAGFITPEHSTLRWDGTPYPFDTWNTNQTLDSAMANSVNWYFHSIDSKLGTSKVAKYLEQINYGNEDMSGGLSSYWLESSLQISPVEQVQLLTALYQESLPFASEHMRAVKNALALPSPISGTLHGKTGTGKMDDQERNGWFVGWLERDGQTYLFATNIKSDSGASGAVAAEITLDILQAE